MKPEILLYRYLGPFGKVLGALRISEKLPSGRKHVAQSRESSNPKRSMPESPKLPPQAL